MRPKGRALERRSAKDVRLNLFPGTELAVMLYSSQVKGVILLSDWRQAEQSWSRACTINPWHPSRNSYSLLKK